MPRRTIGYIWDALAAKPSITLKGGWLAEAGFDTGTPVNVRVLQGCLIITVQEPEQVRSDADAAQGLQALGP